MEEACVIRVKGMTIIDYKDAKSYGKYNCEEIDIDNRMMHSAIFGEVALFLRVFADKAYQYSET